MTWSKAANVVGVLFFVTALAFVFAPVFAPEPPKWLGTVAIAVLATAFGIITLIENRRQRGDRKNVQMAATLLLVFVALAILVWFDPDGLRQLRQLN